jgi:hypothetical protein
LKPTDLDGDRTAVRIIRVASDKPALDTLDDCAAKVGCSFGIFEVPVQVYYEPVAPLCSGLAAVQVGNSLDFLYMRTFVGRTTASSFAYANG